MTTIFNTKYSIKFLLKNTKSTVPTLIIAKLTSRGKVKQMSTKIKVLPTLWDSHSQRSNTRTTNVENNLYAKSVNDKLEIAYNKLTDLCELYKTAPDFLEIVMNDFVLFVNPKKKKSKEIKEKNFSTMYDLYVNFKQNLNSRVLQQIIRTKKYCLEFNPETSFESINQIYMNDFHNFLMNEKNMVVKSAKNHHDNLKTFLKFVQYEDTTININKNYELFKIRKTNKSYHTYLNEIEWQKILSLDNLTPNYEKTRHLLNIMFYTGLRVSDAVTLGKQHVDFENRIITKETIKTREKVSIKISSKIIDSLTRAVNGEFKNMNYKYMGNIYKQLGKLAGIDNAIEVISNKIIVSRGTKPKYELLSPHTQRRSFITNLLKKGANPYNIMKVSGHKTLESFHKYVALTSDDSFNELDALID